MQEHLVARVADESLISSATVPHQLARYLNEFAEPKLKDLQALVGAALSLWLLA